MKEFAKREQIIQDMKTRKIYIMFIQGTKLSDSIVEERKGHTFVSSSNSKSNREHHGVGIWYSNKIHKYRNNYKHIDSHIMTIAINMHGDPLVIASTYIPHDQTPNIPRQPAWELLDEAVAQTPIAQHLVLLGDFNTSLHARKEGGEDYIGEHIFGKGMRFLTLKETYKPAWKTDNKEMLTNLIRTRDLNIKNTFFEKDARHTATYQLIGMQFGPPWTPGRYEEIDHCIVRHAWKNTVVDMQTEPNTNVNTDHFTMIATIRQKLQTNEKERA